MTNNNKNNLQKIKKLIHHKISKISIINNKTQPKKKLILKGIHNNLIMLIPKVLLINRILTKAINLLKIIKLIKENWYMV